MRTVIGTLLTNHGFYFCRDAANAALFIRLAAPFADNLMNSVAHCGCDESQQPALGLLIFEKSLNIVKIVKNKLLRKRFFT